MPPATDTHERRMVLDTDYRQEGPAPFKHLAEASAGLPEGLKVLLEANSRASVGFARDSTLAALRLMAPLMKDLESLLQEFDPVSLKELDAVNLLDRMDTKFVFRTEQLPEILRSMAPDYRVLQVGRVRASRYETLYFDTDALDLYTKHHSGKLNRHKLRYRKYVDSGLCFFEIKLKTNKGRTVKTRTERKAIEQRIEGSAAELLKAATPYAAGELKPKLWVIYTRCTFANKRSPERLTIDLGLRFANGAAEAAFPTLAIAELKQNQSAADSPFVGIMRRQRIREGGMSKYCFGLMHFYPNIKQNLFKENARYIKELAS